MFGKDIPVGALIVTGMLVVLPAGGVFAALICGFPESIEITARADINTITSEWGGIEVLFGLTGLAAGWFSPILAERRWEGSIAALIVIASTWCLAAAMVGLGCASMFRGDLPTGSWPMTIAFIVGAALGIAAWSAE